MGGYVQMHINTIVLILSGRKARNAGLTDSITIDY